MFLGEERSLLVPLPTTNFELCDWKTATVQFNYHIAVDKMYYSVPYQHIKNKTNMRITNATVEIFINRNRIASHHRLYGQPNRYSTVIEHIPKDHQKYFELDGNRFYKWASKIEINTNEVVNGILTFNRVEQQSYRSCMRLLKLADKYSPAYLEKACKKALLYSKTPSYKSVKNLLMMKDKSIEEYWPEKKTNQYDITRGAAYCGSNYHN